jgi:multiple antibiotic resistance protein
MRFFTEVFVTLLVVMDPLGNTPIFLALSPHATKAERNRLAWQAVLVAGSVIAAFALFGQQILSYLEITVPALEGAGGLLLLLVALQLLTNRGGAPTSVDEVNPALVPLGTPLIAGPGAIAATIVFVRQAHGLGDAFAIAGALLAVLAVLYAALRGASFVTRVLRPGGIHLVTRIFGLLLSAIAVQLVAEAIRGFVRAG